jgi:hypothetical protein
MPYTVDKLQEASVIVVSLTESFDEERAPAEILNEITALSEDMTEDGYVIYDCRALDLHHANRIAGMVTEDERTVGDLTDPAFRAIIVATDLMLKQIDEAMIQQLDNADIHYYTDMQEALTQARRGYLDGVH